MRRVRIGFGDTNFNTHFDFDLFSHVLVAISSFVTDGKNDKINVI